MIEARGLEPERAKERGADRRASGRASTGKETQVRGGEPEGVRVSGPRQSEEPNSSST